MRRILSTLTFASTVAATTLLAGLVLAQPVEAQQICGMRDEIVQALQRDYQEQPTAMEVFVSEGGTWTMIASGTDGNSCIIASGEGWDGGVRPVAQAGA
jgi:hypothetical protein